MEKTTVDSKILLGDYILARIKENGGAITIARVRNELAEIDGPVQKAVLSLLVNNKVLAKNDGFGTVILKD